MSSEEDYPLFTLQGDSTNMRGHSHRILMDGQELRGVTELTYTAAVDGLKRLTLTFICRVDTQPFKAHEGAPVT